MTMKIRYTHNSRLNEIFRGEPVSIPTGFVGEVPDAVGEMLVKRNLAVVEAPVAVDPPRPAPAPAKPADPPKHDDRRAEFARKADKKDEDDD